jgi:hypothetical protein
MPGRTAPAVVQAGAQGIRVTGVSEEFSRSRYGGAARIAHLLGEGVERTRVLIMRKAENGGERNVSPAPTKATLGGCNFIIQTWARTRHLTPHDLIWSSPASCVHDLPIWLTGNNFLHRVCAALVELNWNYLRFFKILKLYLTIFKKSNIQLGSFTAYMLAPCQTTTIKTKKPRSRPRGVGVRRMVVASLRDPLN